MKSYRGAWVQPQLESALPHEIVNEKGEWRGAGGNRSAAKRKLNQLVKEYDKRRHGPDDPRNWTIQPVRNDAD